ncbi:hypothetical protein ABW20_dc0100048 [Dactylellina cionopaga]|nr:hypothetical protein ABW20_dc0100048 [Dactylellina cionopaga]
MAELSALMTIALEDSWEQCLFLPVYGNDNHYYYDDNYNDDDYYYNDDYDYDYDYDYS